MNSIVAGVRGTFGTWYGIFGWLVAAVSLTNLLVALFTLPISSVLHTVLATYRTIFHTPIDWVSVPLHLNLPKWAKDVVILYGIVAGVFARIRMIFLKTIRWSLLRQTASVQEKIGKRVLDVVFPLFWPLFIYHVFSRPFVGAVRSDGRQTRQVPDVELGGRWVHPATQYRGGEHVEVAYDERIVLMVQLALVFGAVAATVLVNAYAL